jgi:hypothetical protein
VSNSDKKKGNYSRSKGYILKTTLNNTDDGTKLYINIFQSSELAAEHVISEKYVKWTSKAGENSIVYTAIISVITFSKAEHDMFYRRIVSSFLTLIATISCVFFVVDECCVALFGHVLPGD